MRTQDEIVARIKGISSDDIFGTETSDLVGMLYFDHAKPWLKPDADRSTWDAISRSDETVRKQMAEYIVFAWDKCTDHRGLSSERSIAHFRAWCWLIGDDEAVAFLDDVDNYRQYGAPMLAWLSDRFGWSKPTEESAKNMMAGHPCCVGCESGCGR